MKMKLTISNMIYFFCILTPIMQIINSIFLFDSGESMLGKMFRLVVFIASLYVVMITSKKQTYWILLLFTVSLAVSIYHILSGAAVLNVLLNMMKLLSPYVLISAFVGLVEKNKVNIDFFEKIFQFYLVFVPLSLIIPRILGVGYERYEGSGYQGLYYENNALVLIIIVIFIFSLENLFLERNIKNIVLTAFATFSILINGSKSSMLYFAVVVLLYILRYVFIQNPKQFTLRIIAIIFIIGVLIVTLRPILLPLLEKRIEVYRYYYTGGVRVNGGSILDFFTNGRTKFAKYYFDKFYSNKYILNIIFGIQNLTDIRVEMDPIDIFLYFGIIIVMILFAYLIKTFIRLGKCSFMIKLMFGSILLYSFLAGHVWNSSLAGTPFAMVYAIALTSNKLKANNVNNQMLMKYVK